MIRVPFTRYGIVVGFWRRSGLDVDDALMEAISGYGIDLDEEIDEDDRRTVRELIADHIEDPGDEWEIVNMLGVVD